MDQEYLSLMDEAAAASGRNPVPREGGAAPPRGERQGG
jgi:hypothetical protein